MSFSADSYSDILSRFNNPIYNKRSGLGSSISPSNQRGMGFRRNQFLTQDQIDILLENAEPLNRVCSIIPSEATKLLPVFKGCSDVKNKRLTNHILQYNVLGLFARAGYLANKYGAAYLVMNIDDGLDDNMPVNWLVKNKITKLTLLTQEELYPNKHVCDFLYDDPEIYTMSYNGIYADIHCSRILCFYGRQRYGRDLINNSYKHKPIWETCYSAYLNYVEAHEASLAMLQDASVGIYSIEGLHEMLAQAASCDDADEKATEDIYQRLSMMVDSVSILKKLIIDKDKEDYQYVERNYAHVNEIVADLRRYFIEQANLPASILFNSVDSKGLFSDSSGSDRELLGASVSEYQRKVISPVLLQFFQVLEGYDPTLYIEYPSTVHLTLTEQSKLQTEVSKSLTALVTSQIITPQQAAKRLSTYQLNPTIALTEEEIGKIEDKVLESPGAGGSNSNNAGVNTSKGVNSSSGKPKRKAGGFAK